MKEEKPTENTVDKGREKFFTTPLLLVFMTVLIDLIGFGIVIPILPLYAQSELFHASPLWIGLLTFFDVVFVTLALWTFEPLMTE